MDVILKEANFEDSCDKTRGQELVRDGDMCKKTDNNERNHKRRGRRISQIH